ncbi:MAG: ABC transporter substrate-binding protein [Candidatus Rokubacteria bacterium]|nr:ABC transporter substrate-binding protein [Candidatus Rokubacteria bacterium]
MTNGFTMYLEEIGYQAAGRKIEVIVEDTQAQPPVALTKLRKLVESDRVHVLAGAFLASEGYALAPKVDEYQVPMLFPVVSADDLTSGSPPRRRTCHGSRVIPC